MAVTTVLAAPAAAIAQDRLSGEQVAQLAQITVEIPPQSLTDALALFGRQSGMQVSVDADLVRGKTSLGTEGTMAPEEALTQLLAGTGISFRMTGGNTALLEKAGSDSSAAGLGPIKVVASSETATGPVDGYIAERSATGTKTDTPLIETPQTVNVVTRDQIDAQGAQKITQALRYTPGISSDIRGDIGRFDTVYFRGLGEITDSFQFLDGLRLPRGTSYLFPQVDPYYLERLEVLKGPPSVLYGQAPIGGILSMVSKRPTEETFHEVSLLAGSHNRFQAAFDTGGSINDDGTVLYRVTGLGRVSDTSVVLTEEERVFIAPSVTWQPDSDTAFTVHSYLQKDPKGGYYGFLPSNGTILPSPYGKISRDFFDGSPDFNDFDRTQVAIGYDLNHRFADAWSVQQNARYWHLDLEHSQVGEFSLQSDNRTLNRYAFWGDEELQAVNIDTRLQGELETGSIAHTAIVGLDYQWDHWQQTQGFGRAPTLDILNPDYSQAITRPAANTSPDRTSQLVGLYVQDQMKFDRLGVVLSGRFDVADIESENELTGVYSDQTLHELTWRAGLIYNFDNGLAPFVNYATSFDPTATVNSYGAPFEPTTGQQYEIGLKYEPNTFDGLFTLAAFELTQQNVLTNDPATGAAPNQYIQTGEVRSRGVEFETKVSPIDGLNLVSGITWLDPEVTESTTSSLGKVPVSVSRVTASAWADYTMQSGTFDGLTLGGGLRYVGSAYANEDNSQKIPDYVVADLAVRYDLGRLNPNLTGVSAALNVTNLTDEIYFTCVKDDYCNYGEGRTVLGTLKFRW